MKYRRLIRKISRAFDLASDVGKKEAYLKCRDYAVENFGESLDCNLFLGEAAEYLDQVRMVVDVIGDMAAPTGAEKLHAVYGRGSGASITGNRAGLLYMARVLRFLSASPLAGEHVHFNREAGPMTGDTESITLYYEPDEWFERYALSRDEEAEPYIPVRKLEPKAVIALCVVTEVPPALFLTRDKIYRVTDCGDYSGQEEVAGKSIRSGEERMYAFTITDDRGRDLKLGLDLDDRDIVFFTFGDLEQLVQ